MSPIILNDYCVVDQFVTVRPSYDPKADTDVQPGDHTVNSNVIELEGEYDGEWQVALDILHQPQKDTTNFPYEFRVTVVGRFKFAQEPEDKEQAARFLKNNGSSMLYGIAREVIRTNTSRGPWNAVMIPSVSFYEPEKKPDEKPKKIQKAKKSSNVD